MALGGAGGRRRRRPALGARDPARRRRCRSAARPSPRRSAAAGFRASYRGWLLRAHDPAVASPDHVRARRRPLRRAVRPGRALGCRRGPGAVRPRRLGLGRGLDDARRSPRRASRSGHLPRRPGHRRPGCGRDDGGAGPPAAPLSAGHDRPGRHAAVPRPGRPFRLQPQRRPAGLPRGARGLRGRRAHRGSRGLRGRPALARGSLGRPRRCHRRPGDDARPLRRPGQPHGARAPTARRTSMPATRRTRSSPSAWARSASPRPASTRSTARSSGSSLAVPGSAASSIPAMA